MRIDNEFCNQDAASEHNSIRVVLSVNLIFVVLIERIDMQNIASMYRNTNSLAARKALGQGTNMISDEKCFLPSSEKKA